MSNKVELKTWENNATSKRVETTFVFESVDLMEKDATPYNGQISIQYVPERLCICPLSMRKLIDSKKSIKTYFNHSISSLYNAIVKAADPKSFVICADFDIYGVRVNITSSYERPTFEQ